MAEETLRMSTAERERMMILERVKSGDLTLAQAAPLMRVGYRQAKRIQSRWRAHGASALVHGLRGGKGNRTRCTSQREQALEWVRSHYADYGPTLAAERLAEVHGFKVDHETLRRWMKAEGLWAGRRKERKHRRRRKRRERPGQMLQIDGSDHAWFEDRAAPCCAMVVVDDATSRRWVWFSAEETTEGAMRVLRAWIERWGVPGSIYADRKNVYFPEDHPQGKPTAFGAVCARLSIEMIRSHSPQGKGRVERTNGVLQDRLVKALRERGISTIEEANAFVPEFMQDLNARFEVQPADKSDAHRAADLYDLGAVFAWEEPRIVSRDAVVRFESRFYQLESPVRPGATITVRRRLDGKLQMLIGSQEIAYQELSAPPAPALQAPPPVKPHRPHKPKPDHPWRGKISSRTPKKKAERGIEKTLTKTPIKPSGALPPNPRSLSLKRHPHESKGEVAVNSKRKRKVEGTSKTNVNATGNAKVKGSIKSKRGERPKRVGKPPRAVRPRSGARVALQRSPILRTGRTKNTSRPLARRSTRRGHF